MSPLREDLVTEQFRRSSVTQGRAVEQAER